MIRLDNVCKSYMTLGGRKVVFQNLNLDLPEGRNIGLIGRNGAGKSTLMRLLSAVELPDSGNISTRGRVSWPVGLRSGMQKNLTGRENVKFVCRVLGLRRQRMQEKIRYVEEFAEIGDKYLKVFTKFSPDEMESISDQISDEENENNEQKMLLEKSIEELDFSVRSYNCLKKSNINNFGDIINKTEEEIIGIKNLGKKSFEEIKEKVRDYGLTLKDTEIQRRNSNET